MANKNKILTESDLKIIEDHSKKNLTDSIPEFTPAGEGTGGNPVSKMGNKT